MPAINLVPAGGATCPSTDQRGLVRPFGPACDIGAYERTPPAARTGTPSAVGSAGATVSGTVTANTRDAAVHFEFGKTTAYGGQSAVRHVAGLAPAAVSAVLTGLSPNTTYHVRVVAASSDGATTGRDAVFKTRALPPPVLRSLRLARSAFSAATRGAAIARKRHTGTTVSYTDSQAAKTKFTVLRAQAGIKQGKRCVKPTKRNRRGHPRRCTRYTSVGSFSHSDRAGRNSFHFTARVGGRKLRSARYRLAAKPRAHGASGRTVTISFRIIR